MSLRPSRSIAVGALLGLAGCSTAPAPAALWSWPAAGPAKIRLERSLARTDDVVRGRFFDRLLGREPEPLFVRPFAVAWLGDELLVADPPAGQVVGITPSGKIESTPGGAVEMPVAVAPCRDGVAVADAASGRVVLFDHDLGSPRVLASDLDRPTALACVDGDLWIVETGAHRLRRLGADGRVDFVGERGDALGEFNYPAALGAADGRLFVGDVLNFRVQELDAATGRALSSFGRLGDAPGDLPRIKGIAVDSAERVWVSDATLDLVALFDHGGRFLFAIGERGSGPGQFSIPAGIAVQADGHRVAVADSLNRRVQVFRLFLDGEPQ